MSSQNPAYFAPAASLHPDLVHPCGTLLLLAEPAPGTARAAAAPGDSSGLAVRIRAGLPTFGEILIPPDRFPFADPPDQALILRLRSSLLLCPDRAGRIPLIFLLVFHTGFSDGRYRAEGPLGTDEMEISHGRIRFLRQYPLRGGGVNAQVQPGSLPGFSPNTAAPTAKPRLPNSILPLRIIRVSGEGRIITRSPGSRRFIPLLGKNRRLFSARLERVQSAIGEKARRRSRSAMLRAAAALVLLLMGTAYFILSYSGHRGMPPSSIGFRDSLHANNIGLSGYSLPGQPTGHPVVRRLLETLACLTSEPNRVNLRAGTWPPSLSRLVVGGEGASIALQGTNTLIQQKFLLDEGWQPDSGQPFSTAEARLRLTFPDPQSPAKLGSWEEDHSPHMAAILLLLQDAGFRDLAAHAEEPGLWALQAGAVPGLIPSLVTLLLENRCSIHETSFEYQDGMIRCSIRISLDQFCKSPLFPFHAEAFLSLVHGARESGTTLADLAPMLNRLFAPLPSNGHAETGQNPEPVPFHPLPAYPEPDHTGASDPLLDYMGVIVTGQPDRSVETRYFMDRTTGLVHDTKPDNGGKDL